MSVVATGRSSFAAGTGRQRRTLLSVELETRSTYTAVLLTLTPPLATWAKRVMLALLVWVSAALAGWFTSTFARAVL